MIDIYPKYFSEWLMEIELFFSNVYILTDFYDSLMNLNRSSKIKKNLEFSSLSENANTEHLSEQELTVKINDTDFKSERNKNKN